MRVRQMKKKNLPDDSNDVAESDVKETKGEENEIDDVENELKK